MITPILIAIALYRHLMLALVLARYQEYPRWYYHVKHVKSELKTPSLLWCTSCKMYTNKMLKHFYVNTWLLYIWLVINFSVKINKKYSDGCDVWQITMTDMWDKPPRAASANIRRCRKCASLLWVCTDHFCHLFMSQLFKDTDNMATESTWHALLLMSDRVLWNFKNNAQADNDGIFGHIRRWIPYNFRLVCG